VDVDMVLVTATVTDGRNRFVQGLEARHFRVWEDRIEQEVVHFSNEDSPVTLGIILDRSGSMGSRSSWTLLNEMKDTAYRCLGSGLRDDEYFLIEFSDRPELVTDFTSDVSEVTSKLPQMQAAGRTALLDAIYMGVNKLEQARHPRRALVVLTDGLENRSRYSLSDVRSVLQEREVRLYVVDRVDVQFDSLARLAEMTGGRVFRSQTPCQELAADLRNQYVLGYRSTNLAADGKWREIRVRLNAKELPPGLAGGTVRARSGYYGKTPEESRPGR
jgi:Ca-activated chloride channel family protein